MTNFLNGFPADNLIAGMITVAGSMGSPDQNQSGKAVIDPNSPFQDSRLKRLCEIYSTDPSDERRKIAKRTLRKEYPGEDGPDGDLSIGASMVLDIFRNPAE